MNDADHLDFEAHWHPDGGVTLSHQGQTHTFGGRDSALRFVRDVARSTRVERSLRVRSIGAFGPEALVVSPDGHYYDEAQPGVRETIPDTATFRPRSVEPMPTNGSATTAAELAEPGGTSRLRGSEAAAVSSAAPVAPRTVTPAESVVEVGARSATLETTTDEVSRAAAPPPQPPAPSPAPAESRFVGRRESEVREVATIDSYTGRRRRDSFVDDTPPELAPTHGWRGAVAKLGLKVELSEAERLERADQDIVSQHWPGPRTIAVVNGKGGAGKSPTTICLSATFAKLGGIGVLAWDNNQTRGTLGWRTERGHHDATTLDLIDHTDRLTGPNAQMADLAHFVHHQRRDRYDVLRSQPLVLAADKRMTPAHVQAIHDVAARYYRLIVMDSGNDESDPIWQEMIKHTDQLVVATTTRDDHAEAGALLLEALEQQGGHAASLARSSVVVINQADVKAGHDDLVRVRNGFNDLSREAVTVRYDHGMVDGALRLANLKPTTQRDWLRAAAAVARGL